jgi:hypothetical protein
MVMHKIYLFYIYLHLVSLKYVWKSPELMRKEYFFEGKVIKLICKILGDKIIFVKSLIDKRL